MRLVLYASENWVHLDLMVDNIDVAEQKDVHAEGDDDLCKICDNIQNNKNLFRKINNASYQGDCEQMSNVVWRLVTISAKVWDGIVESGQEADEQLAVQ